MHRCGAAGRQPPSTTHVALHATGWPADGARGVVDRRDVDGAGEALAGPHVAFGSAVGGHLGRLRTGRRQRIGGPAGGGGRRRAAVSAPHSWRGGATPHSPREPAAAAHHHGACQQEGCSSSQGLGAVHSWGGRWAAGLQGLGTAPRVKQRSRIMARRLHNAGEACALRDAPLPLRTAAHCWRRGTPLLN